MKIKLTLNNSIVDAIGPDHMGYYHIIDRDRNIETIQTDEFTILDENVNGHAPPDLHDTIKIMKPKRVIMEF